MEDGRVDLRARYGLGVPQDLPVGGASVDEVHDHGGTRLGGGTHVADGESDSCQGSGGPKKQVRDRLLPNGLLQSQRRRAVPGSNSGTRMRTRDEGV